MPHPRIADAVARQANRLVHVSNLYYTIPQTELARMLVEHSFADRVFFGNSGAEANEAAIKLARKYFNDLGHPERTRIVSMKNSFHGRTMATLSATGQDKIKKGFDPVLGGFSFVPFNDIDRPGRGHRRSNLRRDARAHPGGGGHPVPGPPSFCNRRGRFATDGAY